MTETGKFAEGGQDAPYPALATHRRPAPIYPRKGKQEGVVRTEKREKAIADTSVRGCAESNKRCKKQQRKLLKICEDYGLSAEKIGVILPVIENICWMQIKLEDAREDIAGDGLTTEYDNGGGQTGVRENPAFKAYEALWKSYSTGLQIILSVLPEQAAQVVKDNSENVLELVLNRKRVHEDGR